LFSKNRQSIQIVMPAQGKYEGLIAKNGLGLLAESGLIATIN